jgi:NAD(P) transhydrogenase subunit alpha
MRRGRLLVAFLRPLAAPDAVRQIAHTGVMAFSVEIDAAHYPVPRAWMRCHLMASIAGYKAVVVVADALPRIFPMMTTAAGTITPSRVRVIGAGVAGLQAIASAKRLGAVVSAYDVRPAVKEQVQSLGGRFVELALETTDAQDARGYAKAQDDAFYAKQRELLGKVIADSDAVITTAVVPGKKAPILVTEAMVKGMAPGSVILDLAAERGGNCELTRPGETVVAHAVTIIGAINLASSAPYHASQMYA